MLELHTIPLTRAEIKSIRAHAKMAKGCTIARYRSKYFTLQGPEPPALDAYEVDSDSTLMVHGDIPVDLDMFVALDHDLGDKVRGLSYVRFCNHGGAPPSDLRNQYGLLVSVSRSFHGTSMSLEIYPPSPADKDLVARVDLLNGTIAALGWNEAIRAEIDEDDEVVLRELDGSVTYYVAAHRKAMPRDLADRAERYVYPGAAESGGQNPSSLIFAGFPTVAEVYQRSTAVIRAAGATERWTRLSVHVKHEHYDAVRSILAALPCPSWKTSTTGRPRYDTFNLARVEAELDSIRFSFFRLRRPDTGEVLAQLSYETEGRPPDRPYVLRLGALDFPEVENVERSIIALMKQWVGGRDIFGNMSL